ADRVTEGTQETITNYFAWLQSAMQTSPWGNTELNKKLMNYATETFAAPISFVQQFSQATDLSDVLTIQTKFVRTQVDSFHNHAKERGWICAKMAPSAAKTRVGMPT